MIDDYKKQILDKVNTQLKSILIGLLTLLITLFIGIQYISTKNIFFQKKTIREVANPSITPIQNTTYQIQPGDDLWRISEKFYGSGFNYEDIIIENKMTNPDNLAVGETIIIPKVSPKARTTGQIDGEAAATQISE